MQETPKTQTLLVGSTMARDPSREIQHQRSSKKRKLNLSVGPFCEGLSALLRTLFSAKTVAFPGMLCLLARLFP